MPGSTILVRGETVDCSNPKLDVFFRRSGVAQDMAELEFQIFDIADELNPIQVFPVVVGTKEPVDVSNDCPIGGRLGTGHYVAAYTVDGAATLGPYEIRWFYRYLLTSPIEIFAEQFEIALIDASAGPDPANVAAFKARFPELAGTSNELIQIVLDEAETTINRDAFCPEVVESAKLFLAAHFLTFTSGARAKGAVSVSAGQASISYGALDSAKSSLGSTAYGQRYLSYARQNVGAMVLTGGFIA